MKILCTICARGGSAGVKNKNILPLSGKPMIAHSILQAKNSALFDLIAVSSDSKKIRDISLKWGADHVIERPKELATATVAKLPVIQHAVLEMEKQHSCQFDIIVDLAATSPLRSIDDLNESLKLFLSNQEAQNLITGSPAKCSPYFNLVELKNNGFVSLAKPPEHVIVRRQDSPKCYDMNGSIYIWKRDILFRDKTAISDRTILYPMPPERSIDIDTHFDLKMARWLARSRQDI